MLSLILLRALSKRDIDFFTAYLYKIKFIKPYIEKIDEPCPKCGGKVQIRKTKKRRNYYICENNPNNGCDYISWTKPVKEKKEK